MILVMNDEIKRMRRERDRHRKIAQADYNEARQLFCVGCCDFGEPLQTAYRHYGAAEQLDKTLKLIGYDERKIARYTEHDIEMIKLGIKQRLIGAGIALISLLPIIIEHDATCALIGIPMGMSLIFTKKCMIWREK